MSKDWHTKVMAQSPEVTAVSDAVAFTRVADWLDLHGKQGMVMVAHNKSCDIPTQAFRMNLHGKTDVYKQYATPLETGTFLKGEYAFKSWSMSTYIDFEAGAIASSGLRFSAQHSADGDVLLLVFLLLLDTRKVATDEDCEKYDGGYASWGARHDCEDEGCPGLGHRGPLFETHGFRCIKHGGTVQTHRCASPGCHEKGHDGGDGVLRCQLHGGVVTAAKKVHTKKIQAAFYQKNKEAERGKKQIAEDELVLHGYSIRGGGLTASRGGKYVATFDQKKPTQITATSGCPHVAALVFNLFKGGEPIGPQVRRASRAGPRPGPAGATGSSPGGCGAGEE
jgi:hypothetical protein